MSLGAQVVNTPFFQWGTNVLKDDDNFLRHAALSNDSPSVNYCSQP